MKPLCALFLAAGLHLAGAAATTMNLPGTTGQSIVKANPSLAPVTGRFYGDGTGLTNLSLSLSNAVLAALVDTNRVVFSGFESNWANVTLTWTNTPSYTNHGYYTNWAGVSCIFFYNSGTGAWSLKNSNGYYFSFRIPAGAMDGKPTQGPVTNAWGTMYSQPSAGVSAYATNYVQTNLLTLLDGALNSPVPYAGKFVGDGSGLTNLLAGSGGTNGFNASKPIVVGTASDGAKLVWSNTNPPCSGTVYYPSYSNLLIGVTRTNLGQPGGNIAFPDRNGIFWKEDSSGSFPAIYNWVDHSGACGPLNELQVSGGYRLALMCYGANAAYETESGIGGGFQMGTSGTSHDSFWFQYDTPDKNPGLGFSKLVSFKTRSGASNVIGFASIRGVAVDTNSDKATIQFYSGPRHASDNSAVGDGTWNGGTLTNGWNFRGKLVQEKSAQSFTAANLSLPLDFNSTYCVDIALGTGVTNVAFYTTNRTQSSGDFEQRFFLIRASGAATLQYPNWTKLRNLPTNISAGQLLQLDLKSVGAGEGNVLASTPQWLDTVTVPTASVEWDADATNYLTSAQVTNQSAKLAFNDFVKGLKDDNVWSNLVAFWPMYGTNATQTAKNLIAGSPDLTYHGTMTHALSGVTGGGAANTDWADTGINPKTLNLTNLSLMVWNQTATNAGAAMVLLGVAHKTGDTYSNTRMILDNGALKLHGPHASAADPSFSINCASAVGCFIVGGTNSAGFPPTFNGTNLTFVGGDLNTAPPPDNTVALFARHYSDGTTEANAAAKLAGAALGRALTSNQQTALYNRLAALQAALGR